MCASTFTLRVACGSLSGSARQHSAASPFLIQLPLTVSVGLWLSAVSQSSASKPMVTEVWEEAEDFVRAIGKALFPAALIVDDSIRRIFPAESSAPSHRRIAHFTRASQGVSTRSTFRKASVRASSGMA